MRCLTHQRLDSDDVIKLKKRKIITKGGGGGKGRNQYRGGANADGDNNDEDAASASYPLLEQMLLEASHKLLQN